MKKLLRNNKTMNLAKFNNFGDFLNGNNKLSNLSGYQSESDADDVPDNKVDFELPKLH